MSTGTDRCPELVQPEFVDEAIQRFDGTAQIGRASVEGVDLVL